jgi:hypothetical protein
MSIVSCNDASLRSGRNSLAQRGTEAPNRAAVARIGVVERWDCLNRWPSAVGTSPFLPEYEPRIVGNPRSFEQRGELLLKTACTMMLCLICDVFRHCRPLRLTHAKSAVSFLPLELSTDLAEPS